MFTMKLSGSTSSSTATGARKLLSNWFSASVRYELPKGEVQRLNIRDGHQWLRVLSGVAWVSYNDEAAVLTDNEAIKLTTDMRQIMISAEKGVSLTFEILRDVE